MYIRSIFKGVKFDLLVEEKAEKVSIRRSKLAIQEQKMLISEERTRKNFFDRSKLIRLKYISYLIPLR